MSPAKYNHLQLNLIKAASSKLLTRTLKQRREVHCSNAFFGKIALFGKKK
jgi:hypothetical protein